MSRMYWFRLYSEFRNDPKIKRLPICHRYAFIVLLCIASESESRGVITGLDDEDLAFELEMQLEDWKTLKAKFKAKGFIDFTQSEISICNWEKRQYEKPSDLPEATRERKRLQREREKLLKEQNVTPVTPLSQNVTHFCHADPDPYSNPYSNSEDKEKEILKPLSFFPSGEDQESEVQNKNSFSAQTKDPNIQDPQTPKPLSPIAPENVGKPILKGDRVLSEYERRRAYTKVLTDDEDFLKYLFVELKKGKDYFRQFGDQNYKPPVKEFIEISWESTPKGDRRFGVIQDHKEAYDRYKAAKQKAEEERQLMEEDSAPRSHIAGIDLSPLQRINADRRSKGLIFTQEDYEVDRLKESSTIYAVSSRRAELGKNVGIAS